MQGLVFLDLFHTVLIAHVYQDSHPTTSKPKNEVQGCQGRAEQRLLLQALCSHRQHLHSSFGHSS